MAAGWFWIACHARCGLIPFNGCMHVVDADADEVTENEDFSVFVRDHEARLRNALTARFGIEFGREAAAEALAYGWEHWDRVGVMDNPIGYLFVVGRDRGRTMAGRRRVLFPDVSQERASWVEPGLSAAVSALSDRQRTAVLLVHGYDWTQAEVAEVLGISKSSVQRHVERAMARLRRKLGVEL